MISQTVSTIIINIPFLSSRIKFQLDVAITLVRRVVLILAKSSFLTGLVSFLHFPETPLANFTMKLVNHEFCAQLTKSPQNTWPVLSLHLWGVYYNLTCYYIPTWADQRPYIRETMNSALNLQCTIRAQLISATRGRTSKPKVLAMAKDCSATCQQG